MHQSTAGGQTGILETLGGLDQHVHNKDAFCQSLSPTFGFLQKQRVPSTELNIWLR